MIRTLGLARPAWLYRALAAELGVHPGTVLRYHRHELRTLEAGRLRALEAFHRRVENGDVVAPPSRRRGLPRGIPKGARVPTSILKPLLERVMKKLGLKEKQIVYRSLAERTNLHTNTLLQYFTGSLESAPASVETALRTMLTECNKNGCPTLTRTSGGEPVVPRAHFRRRVDRSLDRCGYPQRSDLFRDLSEMLETPIERVSKAYYDRRLRFVPKSFCEAVDELSKGSAYDCSHVFRVGQRIRHGNFGTGVVAEKLRKNIIRVELDEGGELLLREAYRHDPYRMRRSPDANPESHVRWAM